MDYVYAYLSYFGYRRQGNHGWFLGRNGSVGQGSQPEPGGVLQFVGVAETREKALELYREPAEYFYGRCLFTDPMWANSATSRKQRSVPA